MRHPEVLRDHGVLYTEVQLTLLYLCLKCNYCDGQSWDPATAILNEASSDGRDILSDYRALLRKEEAIQKLEELQIKTVAENLVQRAKTQLEIV